MAGIYEFRRGFSSYPDREAVERRYQQISPGLDALARKAISAYDALRLSAGPLGETSENDPVYRTDIDLGGKVVGHYIHVTFDEHHKLHLYNNSQRTGIISYSWQFRRACVIGDLTETTKITKYAAEESSSDDSIVDIEVNRYTRQHLHSDMCSAFSDYSSAEDYIVAFEGDIEQAVSEFGV